MPRRRSKRRLKKRQGVSPLQRLGKIASWENLEIGRQAYEKGYKMYKGAKAVHKQVLADARKGRGSRMKKKDPVDVWSDNSADGIKYHTKNIIYKKSRISKIYTALSQPGVIYQYAPGGNSSTQGTQNNAIVAGADSAAINQLYTGLDNAVATTSVRASAKLYYKGTEHQIQFMNAGPTTCEFEIYICIDKTTNAVGQIPNLVWSDAIANESNDVTVPVESATDLWLRPTSFKGFNIAFWTKRIKCVLTAGEKCNLNVHIYPQRLLDMQYVDDYDSIRGITHQIMVVQRGSLGDGTQTFAVTAGQQSITPSKLVWMTKRSMKGSILGTLPRVHKQVSTEIPTALAALFHIDEDTGEPEDSMNPLEYA